MDFDELNINILSYLYVYPHSTTSKITKGILYSEDTTDFRKNDCIIRYRLKEMLKNGLVENTGEKKAKYKIVENFIVEGVVEKKKIYGVLFLVDEKYPILIGFNKKLIKSI